MDRDDPPFPPQRPLEKHVRIEADLFCANCGYNLHTQPVVRDERLGILVVRCTECGRFQPAGVASNATRVWLSRLATIILAVWIIGVTGFAIGAGFGMGGLQVAHVELLTTGGWFAPDGTRVYPSWDPVARKRIWVTRDDRTVEIVGEPAWRRTLQPDREIVDEKIIAVVVFSLILLAPLVFGAVMAAIMWHVPRRRYWMLGVLPVLAGAIVVTAFHIDESARGGNTPLVAAVVAAAVVEQWVMIFTGTRIGRPIARFLASLFVPPRPRQALSFLWTCDGRALPPLPGQDQTNPRSS
jgi:hypothetical protein